jgi:hypothetical protein
MENKNKLFESWAINAMQVQTKGRVTARQW